MFGAALKVSAGSKERNESGGLTAPVVVSVDSNVSVCNDTPAGFPAGWKDCVTLSGGPVDEATVESLYTHFTDDGAFDTNPPAFPGPSWVAYTGNPSDNSLEWDQFGSDNGPLQQPTAAGPYIGALPWNEAKDFAAIDGGGGANWWRIEVTISNAAGSDTFEIFYQSDCF